MPRRAWVLLAYRFPPGRSTPRISVWRRLRQLGAVQVGDGLAGLPHDTRTREALDWVAEDVLEAGGEASVWLADAASASQAEAFERRLRESIAAEYEALIAEARRVIAATPRERRRSLARLRRQLARIRARDHLPASAQGRAEAAVETLSQAVERSA